MLGPGPEDLAAMGSNLMSADRRRQVLETSLRTSLAALRRPGAAGAGGPQPRRSEPGTTPETLSEAG